MVLDTIGSYNPTEKPEIFKVDKERVVYWQQKGALISESLKKLMDGSYKFVAYPSAKKLKAQAKKDARTKGATATEVS